MMAIMTDGNKEELPKEFVEGGRTGRRNAMPDILHSDANVTTADLPARLEQLATSEMQSASGPPSLIVSVSSNDSDEPLKKFSESSCSCSSVISFCGDRSGMPGENDVTSSTTTEDINDRLEEFLKSGCSRRRNAVCDIDCEKLKCLNNLESSEYPNYISKNIQLKNVRPCHREHNPQPITQVINLDERKIMEMLNDPNSPQPGPSGTSQESNDQADKKGS